MNYLQQFWRKQKRANDRTKASASRRGRFERMEDRLVLTSVLQFDSVVVAGGDHAVYPKSVITDAAGATYMGGYFYETADFDLSASLPGDADLLTARGGRDAFVAKYAPNGSLEWAKRMGGDATSDYVHGLERDTDGNLHVAGDFGETADFGPFSYQSAGKNDGFLAKLDSAGDFQWVQTWGGPESNTVDELVIDSNGLLTIIGGVREDANSPDSLETGIQIRQYDAAGNATWDYFLANDTYGKPDLAVAPTGDLVAVGQFRDTLDLDLSEAEFIVSGSESVSNIFVLGLSSGGEFQWGSSLVSDKLADSTSSMGIATVAVANDGSAAVLTSGRGELRLGVGLDEQQVSIGEVRRRVFTSFSSTGQLQATAIHQDEASALWMDVAAVGTGFYVAGSNNTSVVFQPGSGVVAYGNPSSVFVMGVDEGGIPQSAIIVGGMGNELTGDIRLGADGNLLVTSSSSSSSIDFDPDPIHELIHINPNGPDNSADAFALSLSLPEPGQPITVFGDSFEHGQWDNKWVEDSQNDWFTSTQRATVGNYSAEVDGRATNATLTMSTPLDLSGYESAELTFDWLIEKGFDSGEYLALDVYDGSSWTNDVFRLNGNSDPENTWHGESVDLTPYLSSETLVRFRVKVSSSREDANVDNVRIVASGPASLPPTAVDDAFGLDEDNQLAVTAPGVLLGDSDPESDPLSVVLATDAAHGELLFNSDGSFTYTPDADFHGTDSFTYRASDGTSSSNEATVTLSVAAVNDAPVAHAQTLETEEGSPLALTLAASDVDGDAVTFEVVDGPTGGTLSGTAPNLIYTPAAGFIGADSFTFVASDGTTVSAPVAVSISVTEINAPPAADPLAISTDEDTSVPVTLSGSDPEGEPITYEVLSGPTYGSLSGTAPHLTYTPDANHHGSDSFTYRVSDGENVSGSATVSISVASINDAPVATSESYSMDQDTTLTVPGAGVLANDTDADGDVLTAQVASGPGSGTLVLETDGSFTYTPDPGFVGTDSITYVASDGLATSLSTTVSITINEVADESTMHVGDLDGSAEKVWYWWQATVSVRVVDQAGNAVAGATITAQWSGGSGGSATVTTDSNGWATVYSGYMSRRSSEATLTVLDITHDDFDYLSTDNEDPEGDSSGTSIRVFSNGSTGPGVL